ncbi:hypothetical protein F4818DRAFT_53063 [Hypoxylon cercidicola]|nr:hypothetical protein F4818DRAFT_53063 [Hypoxylon cercidicola]
MSSDEFGNIESIYIEVYIKPDEKDPPYIKFPTLGTFYCIYLCYTQCSTPQCLYIISVPGLVTLEVNSPLVATASRSLGFNFGLVSVLETTEHLMGYATHPAHKSVMELREKLCEETLVYDLEF